MTRYIRPAIPIYADQAHRDEHDRLIEKAWRARVWLRMEGLRRRTRQGIPRLIARKR